MFERFTARARDVVREARLDAERAGADVDPARLLMAVLADEACLAARVVHGQGVTAEAVRVAVAQARAAQREPRPDELDEGDAAALEAIGIDLAEIQRRLGESLDEPAPTGRRSGGRFTRGSKKALELSLREAIALRHNYIGTEHLLLGLARCEDPVVDAAMHALGLERHALRDAVREALRRAG